MISNIPEAIKRLNTYAVMEARDLPEFQREKFIESMATASPVDFIIQSAEILYAGAEDIDDKSKGLAADLFEFATTAAWHGLHQGRGMEAVAILRGEPRERAPTDPAPKSEFTAPKPEITPEIKPEPKGTAQGARL